jgi:hypothetical protein
MLLRRLLDRLFPKLQPQSVELGELGPASSDRYGNWSVARPVILGGVRVGLCFQSGAKPPDQAALAHYYEIALKWPEVWAAIVAKLREELDGDAVGERERFLAAARAVGITFGAGGDRWEVQLEPTVYDGHIVSLLMSGCRCEDVTFNG